MFLTATDFLLHFLHLGIMVFNLFGWIPPKLRKYHRIIVGITAFFWLVVGPAIGGIGYCPLTHLHWNIKRAAGETGLPSSYVDYLLQEIGLHLNPFYIDMVTGGLFAAIVLISACLYWREKVSAPADRS